MKEFVTKQSIKPTKSDKKKNNEEREPQAQPSKDPKKKLSKKERINQKRRFKISKLRQSKTQIEQNLAAAQSSTKSVGRFDRKAHSQERIHKVKRRKEYSNFSSLDDEETRNKEIFDLVRKGGVKKLQHPL